MTDLMAGVAVTFLIIAAIFMLQRRAQEDVINQKQIVKETKESEAKSLIRLLETELKDGERFPHLAVHYDPKKDPFLLTITLTSDHLRFQPGRCDIPRAEEFVAAVFEPLLQRVCRAAESGYLQSITLEGHTDNIPYRYGNERCGMLRSRDSEDARLDNNIRLSAARAQNVFFAVRQRVHDERLRSCLLDRFVVSGRGPVEPLQPALAWSDDQTEEQRHDNRRVVIKIRADARGAADEGDLR